VIIDVCFYFILFYQRCFRVQLSLCSSAPLVSVGVAVAAAAVAVVGLSVNATAARSSENPIAPSPIIKKNFYSCASIMLPYTAILESQTLVQYCTMAT